MRRPLLWPLVPLYRAGLMLDSLLRAWGFKPRVELRTPVISVGSLSAGGAGKTPVVMLMAEMLANEGLKVAILSRGYGRRGVAVERVLPEGDAARFGDEPLMMAQQGEARVYVGADRFAAGRLAEQDDGAADVFLLDDGFQHRRLARALDVVLLTEEDARDHLLPAGNLREPITALRRADVVVLRENEARLARVVAEVCQTMPAVWVIRRRLVVRGGAKLPERVVAFCGIARPESFAAMLTEIGCEPANLVALADHHAYGDADVERLLHIAEEHQAGGFVTTEKDAVKWTAAMRARLAAVGPMVVTGLEVDLVNRGAAVGDLVCRLERVRDGG